MQDRSSITHGKPASWPKTSAWTQALAHGTAPAKAFCMDRGTTATRRGKHAPAALLCPTSVLSRGTAGVTGSEAPAVRLVPPRTIVLALCCSHSLDACGQLACLSATLFSCHCGFSLGSCQADFLSPSVGRAPATPCPAAAPGTLAVGARRSAGNVRRSCKKPVGVRGSVLGTSGAPLGCASCFGQALNAPHSGTGVAGCSGVPSPHG